MTSDDPRHHRRASARRRRPMALAAGLMGLALVVAGCGDDRTPAEQRADRVQERLEMSFSQSQVDCIMDRLDAASIKALDASTKLAQQSTQMEDFSEALAFCVTGTATSTTTTAPTTTAPADGVTTTLGG